MTRHQAQPRTLGAIRFRFPLVPANGTGCLAVGTGNLYRFFITICFVTKICVSPMIIIGMETPSFPDFQHELVAAVITNQRQVPTMLRGPFSDLAVPLDGFLANLLIVLPFLELRIHIGFGDERTGEAETMTIQTNAIAGLFWMRTDDYTWLYFHLLS